MKNPEDLQDQFLHHFLQQQENELQENIETFLSGISRRYVEQMRNTHADEGPHLWGGDIELIKAGQVLGVKFKVWKAPEQVWSPELGLEGGPVVHLYWTGGHYELYIPDGRNGFVVARPLVPGDGDCLFNAAIRAEHYRRTGVVIQPDVDAIRDLRAQVCDRFTVELNNIRDGVEGIRADGRAFIWDVSQDDIRQRFLAIINADTREERINALKDLPASALRDEADRLRHQRVAPIILPEFKGVEKPEVSAETLEHKSEPKTTDKDKAVEIPSGTLPTEEMFSLLAQGRDEDALKVIQAAEDLALEYPHAKEERTLVDYAFTFNCLKTARYLLLQGADITTPRDGKTTREQGIANNTPKRVMTFDALIDLCQLERAIQLQQSKANRVDSDEVIVEQSLPTEEMFSLLAQGKDVEALKKIKAVDHLNLEHPHDTEERTLVDYAFTYFCPQSAQYLLSKGADITTVRDGKLTLEHGMSTYPRFGAKFKRFMIWSQLERLIESAKNKVEVNVEAKPTLPTEAMFSLLAQGKDLEALALIKAAKPLNLEHPHATEERTLVDYAFAFACPHTAHYLLTQGSDISTVRDGRFTIEHGVANHPGKGPVFATWIAQARLEQMIVIENETGVQACLELGADVNVATEAGVTPLMLAAQKGSLTIIRALIDAGAKPSTQDKQGKTAADYTEVADVKAELDINFAIQQGYTEIVRRYLQSGQHRLGGDNPSLSLVLHWAAWYGHLELVKLALTYQPDLTVFVAPNTPEAWMRHQQAQCPDNPVYDQIEHLLKQAKRPKFQLWLANQLDANVRVEIKDIEAALLGEAKPTTSIMAGFFDNPTLTEQALLKAHGGLTDGKQQAYAKRLHQLSPELFYESSAQTADVVALNPIEKPVPPLHLKSYHSTCGALSLVIIMSLISCQGLMALIKLGSSVILVVSRMFMTLKLKDCPPTYNWIWMGDPIYGY